MPLFMSEIFYKRQFLDFTKKTVKKSPFYLTKRLLYTTRSFLYKRQVKTIEI